MEENNKIKELELKILLYEKHGAASLFFALNRKMNEIAELLNAVSLKNLDISSKSDASFERVFKLLEKSESISSAAKALGDFAGINKENEENESQLTKYRITTPESIANVLGNTAGKQD